MGRNEFEEGTIVLPAAAFAAVKKAVRDAAIARRNSSLEVMLTAYGDAAPHQLRDAKEFERHLNAFSLDRSGSATPKYDIPDEDRWILLYNMRGARSGVKMPRASHLGPAPTNRQTRFESSGGILTFDPKTKSVEWSVSESKNAVERARSGAAFVAFEKALKDVRWTRGTGGEFFGNDEYHQDGYSGSSGGGNYSTFAVGPIGAASSPRYFEPFIDSTGVRHTAKDSKYAQQGLRDKAREARALAKALTAQSRVGRGVPAGGQFAGNYRTESPVQLSRW